MKTVKVEFDPTLRKTIKMLSIELNKASSRYDALREVAESSTFQKADEASAFADVLAEANDHLEFLKRKLMRMALKKSTYPIRMAKKIEGYHVICLSSFPWVNVTADIIEEEVEEKEEEKEVEPIEVEPNTRVAGVAVTEEG